MQGIYVKSKGTFYHMDYGTSEATHQTSVDRVLRILIQRDIVQFDTDPERNTVYKVMTLDEAKENGAKIEAFPISPNVKAPTKEPRKRR